MSLSLSHLSHTHFDLRVFKKIFNPIFFEFQIYFLSEIVPFAPPFSSSDELVILSVSLKFKEFLFPISFELFL